MAVPLLDIVRLPVIHSGVTGFLLVLRPLLLLLLVSAVFWLAARALRRLVLGRVGELGKFLLLAALVAFYALTVVLTAMSATGGGGAPWMPLFAPLMTLPPRTIIAVVAGLLAVWLVARELVTPMPHWFGFILDSPLRRLFMPAEAVLHRMALGPGMRVVEIGCGTGHLTVEVPRRIKPNGVLFSVDIQPEMVEKTRRRVERAGLDNVQTFVAPAEKLPFDIFDADLVFIALVLGEIQNRLAALREVERVLRPGGVLSISESLLDPHYRFRNDVVRLGQHAGFEHVSTEGSLFSYTATFRKPASKEPLGYVPRFG